VGKLGAFLRLARIEHGVMAAFATAVGCAVGAGGWFSVEMYRLALAAAVTVAVEVGLFVFNDVFNLEEDRVNAPDRPLVKGEVSLREAIALGAFSLALGGALAAALGPAPFLIAALAVLTGMAYNARLKKSGFPGNVVVALDTALPFLFGAAVASGVRIPLLAYLFTLTAFLAALGREVLKGIVDLEGDLRAGVRTVAATKGVAYAAKLSSALLLAAVSLSVAALTLVKESALLAYTALVSVTDALFAYVSATLLLRSDKATAEKGRRTTLLAMFTGTLAFAAAA